MAGNDKLTNWWAGLDEQMRAEALAAQSSDKVTDELASSLASAGVTKPPKPGRPVPPDLLDFLKMRH